MSENKISRRSFLGTAAASGVGLVGLAACGGGTQQPAGKVASAAHAGASVAADTATHAAAAGQTSHIAPGE